MTVTCAKCVFYFVTHDPARPWGCKKFGFKSHLLPNYQVKSATGMECAYYKLKKVNKTYREKLKNGNPLS
jgi:hypothetical protein